MTEAQKSMAFSRDLSAEAKPRVNSEEPASRTEERQSSAPSEKLIMEYPTRNAPSQPTSLATTDSGPA